jgi:YidC/Oxa1 family membrane protein insertase
MTPIVANILQPLIDVFEVVLKFFHDDVGFGWGFSIVALTITVRALLLPLTLKQVKSMRGLQQIAPEMKKLQAKYKDDKQRLNQEMMKLYSEHKVNPFASCLPLLAQLPVFIALFYLLQDDLRRDICGQTARPCGELGGAAAADSKFLFIPDITDNATGAVLITLIVLYVASQLVSSLLMSVSADKNQRYIFLALPFIFIPFVINFPAGLLVYWITTNLWTIVQQFIVRRTVGPVVPPGKDDAKADGKDADAAAVSAFGRGNRQDDSGNGNGAGRAKPSPSPAPAAVGAGNRRSAPPPPPSKRKKKRSGRRR